MCSVNVLIITYNQHDVIGRAIESALAQKGHGLSKIIISDDCSPDNTWEVVSRYAAENPDIIEAYHNEHNLGIYQNMDALVDKRGNADLYYFLSGDDALDLGYFKRVQEFIKNENVDVNEPIGIYSDWNDVFIDGRVVRCKPKLIEGEDPLSLYIRGMIGGRSQLLSRSVINQYSHSVFDKGLALAESFFDSQAFRFAKKFYYIPCVGSYSYRGIGISNQLGLDKSDYWTNQQIDSAEFFIRNFLSRKEDIYFEKYIIEYSKFYLNPSFLALFRALNYYNKGKLKRVSYSLKDYAKSISPLIRFYFSRLLRK